MLLVCVFLASVCVKGESERRRDVEDEVYLSLKFSCSATIQMCERVCWKDSSGRMAPDGGNIYTPVNALGVDDQYPTACQECIARDFVLLPDSTQCNLKLLPGYKTTTTTFYSRSTTEASTVATRELNTTITSSSTVSSTTSTLQSRGFTTVRNTTPTTSTPATTTTATTTSTNGNGKPQQQWIQQHSRQYIVIA